MILSLSLIVWYIIPASAYWFVFVESSLHLWNDINLIVVGDFFFLFFFFSFACKLPWILTASIYFRVLNYCVSIFYRHGCLAFISACLVRACHAHNAFRGQKKVLEPSELEFQMVAGIHLGAGTLLCHLFVSSLTFNVARLDLSFSLMVPYRNECVFPALKYSKIERVLHHFFVFLASF